MWFHHDVVRITRERRSGYRSLSQADLERFYEEQRIDPLYRLIHNRPYVDVLGSFPRTHRC